MGKFTTESREETSKSIDETEQQVEAIETIEQSIPATPAKPQTISRIDVDARAKQLGDRYKLPKPPGTNLRFPQLMEYLKLFTEDHWQSTVVYVYRLKPICRKPDGEDRYINKIGESFDESYIRRIHGGGVYRFSINDTSQKKSPQICQSILSIPLTECDPIIDLTTLDVNDRDNKSYVEYLKATGKLDNDSKVKSDMQPANIANTEMAGLTNKLLDAFMRKSLDEKQALTNSHSRDDGELTKMFSMMLIEQMKQNAPEKTLAMITGLLGSMKGAREDSNVEVLKMFMQMQSESANRTMQMIDNNMKMIAESIKAQQASAHTPVANIDPIANFTKMFEAFGMFQKMTKGGSAITEESTWDKAIEAAERIGVPILQTVMNAIGLKRSGMTPEQLANMSNNGIPMPTANIVEPRRITSGINDIADNPVNTDQQQQQQQQKQSTTQQQQPMNDTTSQVPQLVAAVKQFGGSIINAVQQGRSGSDFAFTVETFAGTATLAQIINAGSDNLLAAMKSVPEVWGQIAPNPEREEFMKKWVYSFMHYHDEENDDEVEVV